MSRADRASVVYTAIPKERNLATCAGTVYGHVTTRSGFNATMASISSAAASPTRGSARASGGQSLCASTPTSLPPAPAA